MALVIIPGIHTTELTISFVQSIQDRMQQEYFILPTKQYIPYSARAVEQWLQQQQFNQTEPLSFIAFSAGVVGGFGAALAWQLQGGKIHSFVAFDGWGMPLYGQFPIYRISHDYFTHWSSGILGGGERGFYADPEVEHLELWRSPDKCRGWQTIGRGLQTRGFLVDYLQEVLGLPEYHS